jgi:Uma2 family endonuclease
MAEDAAPQPDLSLRIVSRGQSRLERNYLAGAPELAIEIAHSSAARDLGIKSDLYRRHGVREYLVILAQENDVL